MSSSSKNKHFVVNIRSSITGEIEIHPMKAWLRQNTTALPSGVDPNVRTSHELSRALRKLGWGLHEIDGECRLIQPGIDGVVAVKEEMPSGTGTRISERQWIHNLVPRLTEALKLREQCLEVRDGHRLPYTREILSYKDDSASEQSAMSYETDLLVLEHTDSTSEWIPRVIVEAKLGTVTTHDAITYSQKAANHKSVHPFLRYGIFLGRRKHYPLPGRLFRHGGQFDFMHSWKALEPSDEEFNCLVSLLSQEVEASRVLQAIMFNTRSKKRPSYTLLHKPLVVE